ncbi:MAG: hypothetical protein EOO44_00065 [Flavobacterium sp.]|nr:MAG: hypothetical protein EOO44_00065 [Flavobacterium sp.]
MNIGFSTGSIAKGNFRLALDLLKKTSANVIELSALREDEFLPLLKVLDDLDLSKYKYKSFHAPSKLGSFSEVQFVSHLERVARRGMHIVVHPDIITDFILWQRLGKYLCLENMDKRKHIGRTSKDMETLFQKLPDASFCFDIAHAKQVDPTLNEGARMIELFKERLVQVHMSEVNSDSAHHSITFDSILAYSSLVCQIPNITPIVLESPLKDYQLESEIEKVKMIFEPKLLLKMISPLKDSSVYFYNKVSELNRLVNI